MKNTHQANVSSQSKKRTFIICVGVFIASLCAVMVFVLLNSHIQKTAASVIDTYSKRTVVSRKSSYDREFVVVQYTIAGKTYTGKTMRREGFHQSSVPVYYYDALPWCAWYYKKDNGAIVYSVLFSAICLIVVFAIRPRRKAQ
jgi:hypothetical protein